MQATIVSFRRGKHTQRTNQLLLEIEGMNNKAKASKFIGKRVVWQSKAGRKIFGKITQTHGNKGVVRARFSKGLPGEVLGSKIEILD